MVVFSLLPTHPVVACLVLIVDPVEALVGAVLNTVLSDPLVSITASLSQDPRHDIHLPQVNLEPLVGVLILGQPCTPKRKVSRGGGGVTVRRLY